MLNRILTLELVSDSRFESRRECGECFTRSHEPHACAQWHKLSELSELFRGDQNYFLESERFQTSSHHIFHFGGLWTGDQNCKIQHSRSHSNVIWNQCFDFAFCFSLSNRKVACTTRKMLHTLTWRQFSSTWRCLTLQVLDLRLRKMSNVRIAKSFISKNSVREIRIARFHKFSSHSNFIWNYFADFAFHVSFSKRKLACTTRKCFAHSSGTMLKYLDPAHMPSTWCMTKFSNLARLLI